MAERVLQEIRERLGFLNNVGLEYLTLSRNAGTLSGGEQKMLEIGRALLLQPRMILIDEPSIGLAPNLVSGVFEILTGLRESGVTVLMVEQNATRCLQIADRGYVLDQGTNAYSGPGHELLHDPNVIDLYLGTLGRAE